MYRVLALALLAPVAWTQSPAWALADGQAALYDRLHERELRALDPAPKPADPPPNTGDLPAPHNGGVLFRSDLDEKERYLVDEPHELLAVLPRVAFDLRTFKRARVRDELEYVHPFGPLRIDGEADKPADGGEQELRLDVQSPDAAGRRRGAPPPAGHVLQATLIVTRHFDAASGLVDHFVATLEGTIAQPESEPVRKLGFRIRETWTLRDTETADSPRVRERIGQAIQRGVDALRKEVEDRVGRFASTPPPEGDGHAVDGLAGELALGLLTLIKGGVPKDDPLVRRAYDALRARPLRDTYTLGITLMAFESLYADPNERENLAEGLLDRPQPRTPSDADKALMKDWVVRLLDNRDTRVDWGYVSRWTYTGGEAFDNSNTQYALLGLYSAQLCGVDISPSVWWGALDHFVDQQCPSEAAHPLSLVTQRQVRKDGGARRTTTRVDARGWSYTYANAAPYGSMTAAGIAGLTICLAGLRDRGVRGGERIGEAQSAIRSGWAWLGRNFRVRDNPGPPANHAYWRYYYLYGLERACELSQIARIDEHDWYFEGASILLEMQGANGKFANGGYADDCFAVLFLKKASLPVFTGR